MYICIRSHANTCTYKLRHRQNTNTHLKSHAHSHLQLNKQDHHQWYTHSLKQTNKCKNTRTYTRKKHQHHNQTTRARELSHTNAKKCRWCVVVACVWHCPVPVTSACGWGVMHLLPLLLPPPLPPLKLLILFPTFASLLPSSPLISSPFPPSSSSLSPYPLSSLFTFPIPSSSPSLYLKTSLRFFPFSFS